MLIILVGPKGSGKSHIGRVLEKHLGVFFFHVEPLWMRYYSERQASGRQPVISEGIARVHPQIVDALRDHKHVCVETTGASAEILKDLLSLNPSRTVVARVSAPLELCRERIANRDPTHQIPMDGESLRKVYTLSQSSQLDPHLTLENVQLTEAEIVSRFRDFLTLPLSGRTAVPPARILPHQVISAWVDAFNRADVEALASFYTEDAVNHQVAESPVQGREAIREMFESEFACASMVCIVENIFEDGEWAILEWRDPLGLRGCGFFHVVDGKIVFQRGYWDKLSFLRSQGLPLPDK
jgi:shikimate kinase/limonene-1,2-epoxide hydrolase